MGRIIRKHVRIIRRTVDPGLSARFWRKVKRCDSGCWIWRACRNEWGYGNLNNGSRPVRAHRVSYELNIGPIPAKMCVLHSCDNPSCVNPDHLFLGTHADNARDRMLKGRWKGNNTTHPSGEQHGQSKLTTKQVLVIRSAHIAGGISQRALANRFDICQSTISRVIAGKIWKTEERGNDDDE